jgi:hypothetical protein
LRLRRISVDWRGAELSFAGLTRSLRRTAEKRSSKESPVVALCEFAASIPPLGALPH